ncbi:MULTISPECIES: TetR/AcrR family transcriptional regulator [unclassified Streptomyces]|uniref:TetR/AcrR family transcriptional regulator n=1 Tax=unclassified Streptomyces TaxID=2593676 RepID=UPI002E2AE043|nr:TetR/AcrR family transcriptional regulator [Streptomyces sp. NBC_01429]
MSTPEPPVARTRRPPRADTRAALLRAAVRTFGEKGFAQSSLEEVAAAAGLSRGAIYSNFTGKDDLFLALLRETVDERLRQLHAAVRPAPSAHEQTLHAGRAMTRALRESPELHLLTMEFWLRAARDPAVRDHFVTHRREIRAALVELLEEHATARGAALPLPADQLALGIIALFNGFGLEHLIDPAAASPELFAQLLAGLLRARPEGGAVSQ